MKIDKLISGEEYGLKDIFCGEWKIVIPDLQRDYCWGLETFDKEGKKQGELVSQFLTAIISAYKDHLTNGMRDNLTLGIVYGYEAPKGQIQLCDGQQRITTLYLLLGILNRKLGDNSLQKYLISDFELIDDDKEPNLLYAIRESTLYFLSDLVCQYFLTSKQDNSKELNFENSSNFPPVLRKEGRPSWYFSEYDEDMTIQSMLGAIYRMDKIIDDNLSLEEVREFAKFVTHNLKVIYYDMGNRLNGEETFVVINTTGEPLSATENLKPIMIGVITDTVKRKKYSDQWEEREKWFWENRDSNNNKEVNSDALSNDFYYWFCQIDKKQEQISNLRKFYMDKTQSENDRYDILDKIQECFEGLSRLIKELSNKDKLYQVISYVIGDDNENALTELRKNRYKDILLPLIAFSERKALFGNNYSKAVLRFARRIIKNFFDGYLERDKEKKYIAWQGILSMIAKSNTMDELMSFNDPNVGIKNISSWYDQDEVYKEKMSNNSPIEDWEKQTFLYFDLSIIWNESDMRSESYRQRYKNLLTLSNIMSGDEGKKEKKLYNLYVTFRVLHDLGDQVGHASYRSYDAEGRNVIYDNYIDNYNSCYKQDVFLSLLDSKNLVKDISKDICNFEEREKFLSINADNFTTNKYIKAWIIAKMLICNSLNKQMAISDDYIGIYINVERNKICNDLPFSLCNSSAGYIRRYGLSFAQNGWFCQPACLDSPLCYDDKVIDKIPRDYADNKNFPKELITDMEENIKLLYTRFKNEVEKNDIV